MDFFSKALSPITRLLRSVGKEVSVTWNTVWGDSSSNSVNASNLMDNNKNWVYVCVDKIAESVAAIPLQMMKYVKNGDDTEIFDNDALNLLLKPNSQMTGRDFMYITIAHLQLTGNAYWLKDNDTKPTSLFPVNPRNITPKLSKDGMSIESYKFRSQIASGIQEVDYAPSRIIHLKTPNPRNPMVGIGTLESIAEWADLDNYATEFNKKFFQNSAVFGGAIETDATTEEAQSKVRMSLDQNHKGMQSWHKLLILPKGTKLNDQAMTPRDMQMKEADSTFRDKILAGFGVPKSIVGIVEDVNRANAESSNYVFMQFTIKPIMEQLLTYLNEFYIPLFDTSKQLYFSFEDPTPENIDLAIRETTAALASNAYMTTNEVRAKKGLPPVQGGDVIPAPMGGMPVGYQDEWEEEPTEPDITPEDEVDDNGDEPEEAKRFTPKKKGLKRAPRVDHAATVAEKIAQGSLKIFQKANDVNKFAVVHKQFIQRVSQYEAIFMKQVIEQNRKQKQEVIERIRALNPQSAVSPKDIFDKNAEIENMVKWATPVIKKLSKEEGENAMSLVAKGQLSNFLKKDYSVTSRLLAIITASVKRMSRSYTQTTLNFLTKKINYGISEGYGIDKIVDQIEEVYDVSDKYRAERVARTEVFSAANDASKDAYIDSGVVKTIRWKTAEDELTCDECGPLDDKIISVDEDFYQKGDKTATGREIEYENVENPPLHPNCRCYVLPETISVKSVKSEDDEFYSELKQMLHE